MNKARLRISLLGSISPTGGGSVAHLYSCVAVFWASVGSIAYLLLVFSVVPLETVHLLEPSRLVVIGLISTFSVVLYCPRTLSLFLRAFAHGFYKFLNE